MAAGQLPIKNRRLGNEKWSEREIQLGERRKRLRADMRREEEADRKEEGRVKSGGKKEQRFKEREGGMEVREQRGGGGGGCTDKR